MNIVGTKNDASRGPIEIDAESVELRELLDALFEDCGMDFRDYAYSSLKRRVKQRVAREGTGTISGLRKLSLADRG